MAVRTRLAGHHVQANNPNRIAGIDGLARLRFGVGTDDNIVTNWIAANDK